MADIRINALPTTASASSSDDYIALDGTTNGTRKLNAYSPTFGGNLTVSGQVKAGSIPSPGTYIGDFYQATVGSNAFRASHVNGNAIILNPSFNYYDAYDHTFRSLSGTTTYATIKNTGNLLLGTTTDGGQKLQVEGNAKINSTGATTRALSVTNSLGNVDIGVFGASGIGYVGTTTATDLQLFAHNAFVLGFDSAKTATFTGNLTVSGTGGISIGSATFTGGRALTATTGSGNSVSARLLQTGVADWEIKNVATTGALSFQQSASDLMSLSATGNLTVSGTVQINGFSALFKTQTATLATIGSAYAAGHGSYRAEISFGAQNYGSTDAGYIGFRTSATYNTGTLSEVGRFAANGNLLIKSDGVDSGNGKLQLATHTTSAGGIGFGTDTSLFRTAAGEVGLDALSGTATVFGLRVAGTRKSYLYWENGTSTLTLAAEAASSSLKFLSANALALTLDSTQRALFASDIILTMSSRPPMIYSGGSTLYFGTNAGTLALTLDGSQNATFAGDVTVSGGNIGIGTSASGTFGAYVTTSITADGAAGVNSQPTVSASGGSAYAYYGSPLVSTNSMGAAYVMRGQIRTAASAITLSNAYGYFAAAPTLGATSAITYTFGAYIENQGKTGITHAYGINIEAQSGAATTNIGLRNLGATVLATPAAAVTLADNSTMTFELTSNTSLTIKVRGTDGTTRSVALTLA